MNDLTRSIELAELYLAEQRAVSEALDTETIGKIAEI